MPEVHDQINDAAANNTTGGWAANEARSQMDNLIAGQGSQQVQATDGLGPGRYWWGPKQPGTGGTGTGETGLDSQTFGGSGGTPPETAHGPFEGGSGPRPGAGGGEPGPNYHGPFIGDRRPIGDQTNQASKIPHVELGDQTNQAYKVPHVEIGNFGHN